MMISGGYFGFFLIYFVYYLGKKIFLFNSEFYLTIFYQFLVNNILFNNFFQSFFISFLIYVQLYQFIYILEKNGVF